MKLVEIQFADERVLKSFKELEDSELKKFIEGALEDIKKNPFCGVQIPKRLIPKNYIKKYGVRNA